MYLWQLELTDEAGEVRVTGSHRTLTGCIRRVQGRLMKLSRKTRDEHQRRLYEGLRNHLYTLPRDPPSGITDCSTTMLGERWQVTLRTVREGEA